ncbi:hypothetical protein E2C01_051161 [Portunus trituberculatus]|uniref:Secreted protein n=1 Tax=Portunus trituberculatus TaxID=210409 RepID=A0A5B7GIE9_PORTR|nr:hypothetical protein [Portunus trituberculatus]
MIPSLWIAAVMVVVVVVVVGVKEASGRSLGPPFTASPTRRRSWRRRKVVLFKGREFLRVHIKRPIGRLPVTTSETERKRVSLEGNYTLS